MIEPPHFETLGKHVAADPAVESEMAESRGAPGGVGLARAFILVFIAALIGGLGASMLFGDENNLPSQASITSGFTAANQQSATTAVPAVVATPICASCGQDEQAWKAQTGVAPPLLLGKSAALIESCGKMIFGQGALDHRPAASLAKIATALVAAEQGLWREEVDITVNGWEMSARDESSIMGLEIGMRMTVEELVWGLLLRSGNDAAVELARVHGGETRFVGLMNDRVSELGLKDTQFRNPHGLDADGAYSTAFDMTILGKALLANPTLATMVATKDHPTTWSTEPMPNGNWLLYVYPDAIGIKTGYTETAGGTIVGAARRDGRTLIASVFDSGDVFWDSMRLFDWAFANTKTTCTAG